MNKLSSTFLHILGCKYPSLLERFLKIIIKLIIYRYPPKQRARQKFVLRNKIYTHCFGGQVLRVAKNVGKGFYCGGPSRVNSKTTLKDHVCFNGMFINGGGEVIIGNYFHSGTECMIITQSHDYNHGEMIPYGTTFTYKSVIIEDCVWIGRRVTILPGTHIGEGAIIQAGAVVHGEIPPYAIAGGNPAKVFMYRDIEHYKQLKAGGMFYTEEKYCDLVYGKE